MPRSPVATAYAARARRLFALALVSCASLPAACGGSPAPARERTLPTESGAASKSATPSVSTLPTSRRAPAQAHTPKRSLAVQGLLGTIPSDEIEQRMFAKQTRLLRCFGPRVQEVAFLAGEIEFYFRVSDDGRVRAIYPRKSTFGDREAERCMLQVAAATRFPKPQGGSGAEFRWGFAVDVAEDVRPPVAWQEARVAATVAQDAHRLDSCEPCPQCLVTAYVSPGGTVLSAGAASRSEASPTALDCVTQRVKGWTMPDPGSYPAKVTFALPAR